MVIDIHGAEKDTVLRVRAAKLVGGLDYRFNLRGDGEKGPQIVAPGEQRAALKAVLDTLKTETLALPEPLLELIPPRPAGYPASQEDFARRTYPAFDAVAPAEAAAEIVSGELLNSERAARMEEYHARDARNPGFGEVIDSLIWATWKSAPAAGYPGAVQRAVSDVALAHLFLLAMDDNASPEVRALASLKLDELKQWLGTQVPATKDETARAHLFYALQQIKQFEEDPKEVHIARPLVPPQGDPIGDGAEDFAWPKQE